TRLFERLMWVKTRANATISNSGLLQRPRRHDVPLAAMDAAGRALVPGLPTLADAADDEVTARKTVLFVDRRHRGHRAPPAGRRILPRLARAGFAAAEHLAQRRLGNRPIGGRPGPFAAARLLQRECASRIGISFGGFCRLRLESRADGGCTFAAVLFPEQRRHRHA